MREGPPPALTLGREYSLPWCPASCVSPLQQEPGEEPGGVCSREKNDKNILACLHGLSRPDLILAGRHTCISARQGRGSNNFPFSAGYLLNHFCNFLFSPRTKNINKAHQERAWFQFLRRRTLAYLCCVARRRHTDGASPFHRGVRRAAGGGREGGREGRAAWSRRFKGKCGRGGAAAMI